MKTFIRIGVDLAKNFFQIHAIEREGAPPLIRKLSRAKFREFFSKIAATRVGMEACGSAHYWAMKQGSAATQPAAARDKPGSMTQAEIPSGWPRLKQAPQGNILTLSIA